MSKIEKALSQFGTGLNCCQSITTTFGPDYGLDTQKALKIGAAFGGGMSGMGNSCGAVSGSLMIIGLAFRNSNPEDTENKNLVYEKGLYFLEEFSKIHKSVLCRELIGINMLNEEEYERARDEGIFEEKCPNFVKTSAKLLEKIFEQ